MQETFPGQPQEDEISQAQRELDAAQGLDAESPGDDVSQLRAMIDSQNQIISGLSTKLASQLESKLDMAVNAIRRDVGEDTNKQIGSFKTELGREAWLASIEDEESRRIATQLSQEMDRRMPQQAPEYTSAPQSAAPAQRNMEQIYQFVQGMGLPLNDPAVNYAVLNDPALTEQQKGTAFLNSVRAAVISQGGQPAQGVTPAPPAPPPTSPTPVPQRQDSPPVDNGNSQPVGGDYRNVDTLMDAYLEGKLTTPDDPNGTQEYHRRLAALGGLS